MFDLESAYCIKGRLVEWKVHEVCPFISFGTWNKFILARRLLKSLSVKQGIKYDHPESAKDIPTFIQFHNLNIEEILDPCHSFSSCVSFAASLSDPWMTETFNEFFYR